MSEERVPFWKKAGKDDRFGLNLVADAAVQLRFLSLLFYQKLKFGSISQSLDARTLSLIDHKFAFPLLVSDFGTSVSFMALRSMHKNIGSFPPYQIPSTGTFWRRFGGLRGLSIVGIVGNSIVTQEIVDAFPSHEGDWR